MSLKRLENNMRKYLRAIDRAEKLQWKIRDDLEFHHCTTEDEQIEIKEQSFICLESAHKFSKLSMRAMTIFYLERLRDSL